MKRSSEQKFVGARLLGLPENIVNVEGGLSPMVILTAQPEPSSLRGCSIR